MNTECQSIGEPFRAFISESILRESAQRRSPLTEDHAGGYDGLIEEAGNILKQSAIAAPYLLRSWQSVSWVKSGEQRVATDAEVARDGSQRINLYPSVLSKPRDLAACVLLREFGHLLYGKAPEPVKRRWIYKLALPSTAQISAVQGRLTPQYKSYHDLVESFNTAMDRYVALNIANALMANGVPYPQSQNIRLKEWGPTQEYCNRRRYHVLIPLISAYSSKDIFEDFGAAFADWVCGLCGITESSVAEATHEIILEMIGALR